MTVGDIVQLKSGGPPMSVIAINGDWITGSWVEMGKDGWRGALQGQFPLVTLAVYVPGQDEPSSESHAAESN